MDAYQPNFSDFSGAIPEWASGSATASLLMLFKETRTRPMGSGSRIGGQAQI
jgi:hypothetical protein